MKKIAILFITLLVSMQVYSVDLMDIVNGESPTKDTTTIFSQPLDQYMDTIDFKNLDTSVLFLQFDMPKVDTVGSFQIGNGKRINDFLYLGGNIDYSDVGSNAVQSEELGNTSTILTDSNGLYAGHYDEIVTNNDNTNGLNISTNILAGLSLKAFTLGIKAGFSLNDKTISGSVYDGVKKSSIVKKSFTKDGVQTYEETAALYDTDGYNKNSSKMNYYVNGGTQLDLGKLILNLKVTIGIDSTDKSIEGGEAKYTTLFNSALPSYNGISGVKTYTKTDKEYKDVENKLSMPISASTVIELSSGLFTVEPGLTFTPQFITLNGDEVLTKSTETKYTAALDTDYLYLDTTNTATTKISTTKYTNNNIQTIDLPLIVKSKISDRFQFGVKNTLSFSLQSQKYSNTSTESEVTNNTYGDPNKNNTVTTVFTTKPTTSTEKSITTIKDTFNVGAWFNFTDKLRVNLGSTVVISPFESTKTKVENDGITIATTKKVENNVTVQDATTTTATYTQPTTYTKEDISKTATTTKISSEAGLTYFFNEAMTLDLKLNTTVSGNIFATNSWSLLMTIKY